MQLLINFFLFKNHFYEHFLLFFKKAKSIEIKKYIKG